LQSKIEEREDIQVSEEVEKIKQQFFYPMSKYHGRYTPQLMVFDSNLQEFSQRVSFVCALESNGKMTGEETYQEIKKLKKQLKKAKKQLLDPNFSQDDDAEPKI